MGTRHLTCVVCGDAFMVAQYGQWDGYPEVTGKYVLEFAREYLTTEEGRLAFRNAVRAVKHRTEEEWAEIAEQLRLKSGWLSLAESEEFRKKLPELHRDTGCEILDMIRWGECRGVNLNVDFGADSLFCEWAYVLDLDRNVLEVYRGFQTEPHSDGRWAKYPVCDEERRNHKTVYYPIRLVKEYPFDDLPGNDAFIAEFKEKEED